MAVFHTKIIMAVPAARADEDRKKVRPGQVAWRF